MERHTRISPNWNNTLKENEIFVFGCRNSGRHFDGASNYAHEHFGGHTRCAFPSGIEVNTTEKRVNIYPQRFKQIEKILGYVALSNITFEENSANVMLSII